MDKLDASHLAAFTTALSSILSTTIAENTYAQILDGLPVTETYNEYANDRLHEPINNHKQLCPGSLEAVKGFRDDFDIHLLELDAAVSYSFHYFKNLIPFEDGELIHLAVKLAQRYQISSIGSRAFTLRLIEMLAVACHQLAVLLFESPEDGGLGSHKEALA